MAFFFSFHGDTHFPQQPNSDKKMADAWLIVISVIVAVFLFALSFFMLVYYSHPDDVRVFFSLLNSKSNPFNNRGMKHTCPK